MRCPEFIPNPYYDDPEVNPCTRTEREEPEADYVAFTMTVVDHIYDETEEVGTQSYTIDLALESGTVIDEYDLTGVLESKNLLQDNKGCYYSEYILPFGKDDRGRYHIC